MGNIGLVYPYNRQFTPFLRYGGLDFKEFKLSAPGGWGMTGKDASQADDGDYLGITVNSDFNSELQTCDCVIFCDYSLPLDFNKYIYPKMLESLHKKKDIICLLPLDTYCEQQLRTLSDYEGVRFNYYNNEFADSFSDEFLKKTEVKIQAITTPVIFVIGAGEETNKFDIQLALRRFYLEKGYKVSQIGSRKYCECAGFHSFPQFMYDKAMSETKKVICFNNYVKRIETDEKSDIFIIGVPGGIIPLNDVFVQDFGILAYEVSCAVRPDVCILSVYYDQYNKSIFDDVNNSIRHKFGFDIDCINLANVRLDMADSYFKRELKYFNISNKDADEIKALLNLPDKNVFNISNSRDAHSIGEFSEAILEKYSEVVLVNEV
jgi:peptide maturation system protein (TIGR04066 family)